MKKHMIKPETVTIPVSGHKIKLLVLRPEPESGNAPGVLWLHGGGYQSGSARDVFATRALALSVKYGAVLVAPNYRLSGKAPYPAAIADSYAALLYVKEHAGEFGIRSDQIMVGGESAGGGLAAALCILARDRGEVNIAYQMPIYPMLDDRETPSNRDNHAPNWNTKRNRKAWKRYLRGAYGTDFVSCYAAPARCTDYRGLPPAYTYVGDIEPFYDETLTYIQNLKDAGIEAEVDVYPDWFHAYDIFFPAKAVVREAIQRFEAHFEYALAHYFAPQKDD